MPGPYDGVLAEGINGFDFDGTHYDSGDSFGPFNACQMIGFLNSVQAQNPDKGFSEQQQQVIDQLSGECPGTPNNTNPTQDAGSAPSESDPGAVGGDSGQNQGAPNPGVSGTVRGGQGTGGTGDPTVPPTEEPTRPPGGEQHPTHGAEQSRDGTTGGDPIDLFNGAFYLQETDLEVPNTLLPLSFIRVYRSGPAAFGALGWNWDHNYNLYVRELNTGDIALWRNLHEDLFKFDGLNFKPPRGVFEKLDRVVGLAQTFEITGEGGTVMRLERPAGWIDGERVPILWIKDRHGNRLLFSYDAQDKLAEVRDDDDRFLRFEYDQCKLLISVTDHTGRQYEYGHDEQTTQLISATSPGTADHPQGITKNYHYEQPFALPQLRHNIVRVEDSAGNVYLENAYEQNPAAWEFARVTEQLYGGFLYQFRYTPLQWVPANDLFINIPAVRVEVMNPAFGLETYTFNYRGDLLDRRYRLNNDNSFRVVVWQYEYDSAGNLSVTTNPDGSQEINTYDFGNADPRMRGTLRQKEVTAAAGFPAPSRIIWKAKYEPVFQLMTEEQNELGAVSKYRYDFDLNPGALTNTGRLEEVIHPDATLPDGTIQSSVTRFENNNKGQTTVTIQRDGVRNEKVYGNAGNEKSRLVKQILEVGGLAIENEIRYDAVGFESELIDGNASSTKKVYNALGLLEKTILPAIAGVDAEHRFHYNADKHLISYERPKGEFADATVVAGHIIDQIERDVLGYPTKYVLSSNTVEARTLKICPDHRGLPTETINPDGSRIKRIFDERGLLYKEEIVGSDGLKLTVKKIYDRAGKLIREIDNYGANTTYEYDGFSRLSEVVLPNNSRIKYRWLKSDLLESEELIGEDGFGNQRQLSMKVYEYDENGRRVVEKVKSFRDDPAAAIDVTTTSFFDSMDRVERSINHRGGARTFRYDGLGLLVSETDPIGNAEHFAYDNNRNLIRTESHQIEPDGSVSVLSRRYSYDARNRRVETIEPDGATSTDSYDDRNLVVGQIDAAGVVKATEYNSFQNVVRETLDVGGLAITHRWTVDSLSRLTSYTDPTGEVSTYNPDSVGRIFKTEYSNGFSSTRIFNSQGQISEEILGSGVRFQYGYDNANRLSSIKNPIAPAPVVAIEQHEFRFDGMNRVVSAKSGAQEVLRKYDSRNRLLSEEALGTKIDITYDDNTGIVEKVWPDGRTERMAHDLNDVVISIEEIANGGLGSGLNNIATLTPSGKNYFGEAAYEGGTTLVAGYDERKRLVELAISSPAGIDEKIKYRYDRSNKRRVEALLGHEDKVSYFEFDDRYRLTNARDGFATIIADAFTQSEHDAAIAAIQAASVAANHEERYEYNAADARTKKAETGVADRNYAYVPGHRIQNDGINNYSYFVDGPRKSDGVFSYESDALGRIIAVKAGVNDLCRIEFDAFGRPVIIKQTGEPDRSLNYLGSFVEQENENGAPSRQISSHPLTGIPIAFHSGAGTHYTLFDARYNLIGLADTNGAWLETLRYRSFGAPEIYDTAGNPLAASAFGVEPIFGGQRYLPSSGRYLSRRRLMDPVNGVFLSADPKGFVDSPSLYVYSAQDPVNNIDPNGEVIPFIVAAFVIGGAAIGAGYSIYDATQHPERYEGWAGLWRPLAYTFGGAAIGGVSIVAGEAVLAFGGAGIFASGTAATTLTAAQTFVLYGTASAVGGGIGRFGFNNMFPEYIDPVSGGTVATDFVLGGAIPFVGPALRRLGAPVLEGASQMFNRAIGGNWRAFGNTWRMLANDTIQFTWRNIFWNPNAFRNVSAQYWRVSRGADGKALHHLWFQNQSQWVPQGLRNAGFNLLEIPGSLNTWMGGRLTREWAFRGITTSILSGTAFGSYKATSELLEGDDNDESRRSNSRPPEGQRHPNEKPTAK